MRNDANQITRDYYDNLLIEMRHIDNVMPDTTVNYWGEKFAMPIATAALSHMNNTCENGMAKMAEGAMLAGTLCFSGMGEKDEIDDMCRTGAKVIRIIKPHLDSNTVYDKIREAEEAGAFGVGMDIDHAFNGQGDYDCVCGLNMRPQSMEDLKGYISSTKLPFVIKGVLSVSDAIKAVDVGAAGIIVSHHHGILDYAVPPLMVLPDIVKAVGDKLTIFVDCCVETGIDAFKALALGADGVCVGRAIMEPLKNEGAASVRDKFLGMQCELKGAMARTGFAGISDIDDSVIRKRDF